MNQTDSINLPAVRETVVQTLDLEISPEELHWDTPLFGALPELDSLGVVALVAALEDRFDIVIEDDEFGEELFETLGSLTSLVDSKLATPRT